MRGCPVIEVTQKVVIGATEAAKTPAGWIVEAAVAVVAVVLLVQFAAVLLLAVEIIGAILLAIAALTLAWYLGHRTAISGRAWTPISVDHHITDCPRVGVVISGHQCAKCLPVHRDATVAILGPSGLIFVCPDHASPASLRAITGGRS